MPLGEGEGHQRGQRGDVDLQRIDAQVRLPGMVGEPARQGFQVELARRVGLVLDLLGGEEFQRMLLVVQRAATDRQALLGGVLLDAALGDQVAEQVGQVEGAVGGG